jgi:hypothetical protein
MVWPAHAIFAPGRSPGLNVSRMHPDYQGFFNAAHTTFSIFSLIHCEHGCKAQPVLHAPQLALCPDCLPRVECKHHIQSHSRLFCFIQIVSSSRYPLNPLPLMTRKNSRLNESSNLCFRSTTSFYWDMIIVLEIEEILDSLSSMMRLGYLGTFMPNLCSSLVLVLYSNKLPSGSACISDKSHRMSHIHKWSQTEAYRACDMQKCMK